MRKLICLVLLLGLASGAAAIGESGTETGLEKFTVTHGNRESPKIAITMDDCNEREWVWKAAALCREYGIAMTFFPSGYNLLKEERDGWREVLEAGCEIGSHGQSHLYYDSADPHTVLSRLGRFQQGLDDVLGFHYRVRWFRPPFGKIGNNVRAVRLFGYEHSLLWDVSFSPGFTAKDITRNVKNGSIILFHARHRDYECLEEVIPWLLEAGFEPVTVSALFGFDPPETSDELYVFNKKDYQ